MVGPELQEWPQQSRIRGKDHLSWFAAEALPTAATVTVSSLSTKGSLLTQAHLVAHKDPRLLSCTAASSWLPAALPGAGAVLPQVQDSALPLVELDEVPDSPFSSLSKSRLTCSSLEHHKEHSQQQEKDPHGHGWDEKSLPATN